MPLSSRFPALIPPLILINLHRIGIAIGPRTWFGDRYGNNVSKNGVVRNNRLTGAFTYGIAITSAENFQVQNNSLFGNTSFIGSRGPLCQDKDVVPSPAAFIVDPSTTKSTSLQSDFQSIADGDSLTCVLPPNGGDFWPFGVNPSNTSNPFISSSGGTNPGSTGGGGGDNGNSGSSAASSSNSTTGIAVGVVVGVIVAAAAAWFIRKWTMARSEKKRLFNQSKKSDYEDYTEKST